ncbi:MAG: hypothetical protein JNG84_03960, partial [Archangium sp.]|nr:hypothetical protein [Archangium sp.]
MRWLLGGVVVVVMSCRASSSSVDAGPVDASTGLDGGDADGGGVDGGLGAADAGVPPRGLFDKNGLIQLTQVVNGSTSVAGVVAAFFDAPATPCVVTTSEHCVVSVCDTVG